MATTHSALGDALQAWRARLSPTVAGIPTRGRRRVPGLRREELAGLAGVSIDYLIRLEQGRARNPTLDILAELAGALRLNVQEREMLFRIAGSLPPSTGTVPNEVPKGVQQLVDRLADVPVAIFTAAWTIVQWNEMFAALGLQGDPAEWEAKDRNLVWRHFVGSGSLILHDARSQEMTEREFAADLRLASLKYPRDRELKALISGLRSKSETFEAHWNRFEAMPHSSARKHLNHPTAGEMTLDSEVLTVAGSDLRIVVFTAAPGTKDASSLRSLRSTLSEPAMRRRNR